MKIALVKRRYSLQAGGSERYCVNLARRLKARGHDVTIIGEKIDKELAGEVKFQRVPVLRLTSWSKNRSFAVNAGTVAGRGGYDVVYGLGRAFGVDVVRITERLQAHWVNVYYRHPLKRKLQQWNPRHRTLIDLERTIYRSPSVCRIVTQSQLDRRLLIEQYEVPERKICTIYNGVDTADFNPGAREHSAEVREELGVARDEPLLVFASMDFEGKGLRSIFEAVRSTCHRETKLLVLGAGPVKQFQRLARQMQIESRVIFAGRRGDIQRCYGAGDLFVLPTMYEPFPNVNLEAMACGLPVLTTQTAGGADVISHGENGYLIPHADAVKELTECIDRHLSLPRRQRDTMSRRCWELAQGMTIQQNVQQTLDVFEEVMWEKLEAGSVTTFDIETWDDGRLRVNRDFAALLRKSRLTTFDAIMHHEGGQVAKNLLRERTTTRIILSDENSAEAAYYLKRHAPPPWKEYVKPWFRLTRPILGARNEWQAILRFHAAGIPTMVPVALGESRRHSFLLTRSIEDCTKLSEWSQSRVQSPEPRAGETEDPQFQHVIARVAHIARTMHDAGLHHQDFYLTHLLLSNDTARRGDADVCVIDLGRVRRRRRLSQRWIVKDLAQLNYSAPHFSAVERRSFLASYLGRPLTESDGPLIRRIERKTASIARHSRKNGL